jgi:hypothetical protein
MAPDIKAAIELARESLHTGGAEYNECDLSTLAAALLALAEERARMEKVVEAASLCVATYQDAVETERPDLYAKILARCRQLAAALAASSQGGGA